MVVKHFGLEIKLLHRKPLFECFFKELQEKSGNLWPFSKPAKRKQSLYCKILKKDDEYVFAGIILSEALRKKGFSREGDKVEEIKLNAGSEINIFALRLSNFKGLYGGYRGAVTTNKFLTQLWGEYINFVRNKRNACQEDEEFSNASSRFREFSFRKKANSSQLVSDKNFRQMLSNLRSVKEIHFSTVGYDSSIMKWGRSLGDRVTSCRHSLRLDLVEKSAVMGALREAFDACSRITGSGQKNRRS